MTDSGFEEALDALGHEVRTDILRALASAGEPLSFTELRTRTGVDDSGRFNYHLNKLASQFLRRTEDGYELNYRGERVVVAATDGVVTDTAKSQRDEQTCPICGNEDCDRLIHVHLASPFGV